MIVVDTSALTAVLWREPDAARFEQAIVTAETALIAAPTRLEAFLVCLRKRGLADAERMERLIGGLGLITVPFDEDQGQAARDAFRTYGGARGLTFGDCFSYALAKTRGLPLLFKGDDFTGTDVEAA